ncbi:hypothetical protein KIPB_005556 [Kipferlia bialata]|uniref:Uncharacterized protein n=1 Tax=Kipferlia bialata TaxID=797122 RepID=A0A9K3CVK3_9EUKA|nr:hypothetical protein KIPB_005556 [Kipferlia bialata]|eukprot:g5556.t1
MAGDQRHYVDFLFVLPAKSAVTVYFSDGNWKKGHFAHRLLRHKDLDVVHLRKSVNTNQSLFFKCMTKKGGDKTYKWEGTQYHPFMTKNSTSHSNRFLHASSGDEIYLGSVNHRAWIKPGQGVTMSSQRLALLVATALRWALCCFYAPETFAISLSHRWFSDRKGLACCIRVLTMHTKVFTVPDSGPDLPYTATSCPSCITDAHDNITDAIMVSRTLQGLPGRVCSAGLYQAYGRGSQAKAFAGGSNTQGVPKNAAHGIARDILECQERLSVYKDALTGDIDDLSRKEALVGCMEMMQRILDYETLLEEERVTVQATCL